MIYVFWFIWTWKCLFLLNFHWWGAHVSISWNMMKSNTLFFGFYLFIVSKSKYNKFIYQIGQVGDFDIAFNMKLLSVIFKSRDFQHWIRLKYMDWLIVLTEEFNWIGNKIQQLFHWSIYKMIFSFTKESLIFCSYFFENMLFIQVLWRCYFVLRLWVYILDKIYKKKKKCHPSM